MKGLPNGYGRRATFAWKREPLRLSNPWLRQYGVLLTLDVATGINATLVVTVKWTLYLQLQDHVSGLYQAQQIDRIALAREKKRKIRGLNFVRHQAWDYASPHSHSCCGWWSLRARVQSLRYCRSIAREKKRRSIGTHAVVNFVTDCTVWIALTDHGDGPVLFVPRDSTQQCSRAAKLIAIDEQRIGIANGKHN
jgi:hypothetical protein